MSRWCRIGFHRWGTVDDVFYTRYQVCRRCGLRSAVRKMVRITERNVGDRPAPLRAKAAIAPIDTHWIRTGVWFGDTKPPKPNHTPVGFKPGIRIDVRVRRD